MDNRTINVGIFGPYRGVQFFPDIACGATSRPVHSCIRVAWILARILPPMGFDKINYRFLGERFQREPLRTQLNNGSIDILGSHMVSITAPVMALNHTFSYPFEYYNLYIVIRDPNILENSSDYLYPLKPFAPLTWAITLSTLVVILIFRVAVKMILWKTRRKYRPQSYGQPVSCLLVVATVLGFAGVITTCYQSKLSALQTCKPGRKLPVDNLESLAAKVKAKEFSIVVGDFQVVKSISDSARTGDFVKIREALAVNPLHYIADAEQQCAMLADRGVPYMAGLLISPRNREFVRRFTNAVHMDVLNQESMKFQKVFTHFRERDNELAEYVRGKECVIQTRRRRELQPMDMRRFVVTFGILAVGVTCAAICLAAEVLSAKLYSVVYCTHL